jgi:hypothetical protein
VLEAVLRIVVATVGCGQAGEENSCNSGELHRAVYGIFLIRDRANFGEMPASADHRFSCVCVLRGLGGSSLDRLQSG